MNVLIVFAHPEPQSFNGALKDRALATLKAQGHEVVISDLYQMNWQADLEQEHMMSTYGPNAEVGAEQAKVLWCDLMIFQFPMWWFGMPAILKGWVDRVMVRGFAYVKGRKYDTGMFKGRRAMVSTTTGTAASLYEPDGIDGDLNHILWPIHNGIFRYLGFDVLPPVASWMPGGVSATEREGYLAAYAEQLKNLNHIKPLFFHPSDDYGPDQRLKPGVVARSGFQWNPEASKTN
jgi:NAD(P)H dehydrogenase (quinone)